MTKNSPNEQAHRPIKNNVLSNRICNAFETRSLFGEVNTPLKIVTILPTLQNKIEYNHPNWTIFKSKLITEGLLWNIFAKYIRQNKLVWNGMRFFDIRTKCMESEMWFRHIFFFCHPSKMLSLLMLTSRNYIVVFHSTSEVCTYVTIMWWL